MHVFSCSFISTGSSDVSSTLMDRFLDFNKRYNQCLPKVGISEIRLPSFESVYSFPQSLVSYKVTAILNLQFPVNLATYLTLYHRNYITDRCLCSFYFTTQSTMKTNQVQLSGHLFITSAILLVLPTSFLTATKADLNLFTFLGIHARFTSQ
jgi:ribosomal protein L31